MKLIEKKCPNCGAELEFSETDKSCKCSYCKRSFEIERDTTKENINEQYDLKPAKALSMFVLGSFAIVFVAALIFIIIIFTSVFSNTEKESENLRSDASSLFDKMSEKEQLITSTNELSNQNIKTINFEAEMEIPHTAKGQNDTNHYYSMSGKAERQKLYVAYQKENNYIILIYKTLYHDTFHQENQYTVYVPVVFEDVTKNVTFSLGDGEIKAPEYYFNSEKTSYVHGFASFDEAYNEVVKPLENEYKITEK